MKKRNIKKLFYFMLFFTKHFSFETFFCINSLQIINSEIQRKKIE